MRRLVVFSLAIVVLLTSVSVADEQLTKKQIINRSAPICTDLLEAIRPHIEKANDAMAKEQWDRFIREGRRTISTARPFGRELWRLLPETGARKYRRFLNHAREALNRLDRALDAFEAERLELAKSRRQAAQDHLARARRAARRYGLRRSCIKVVS